MDEKARFRAFVLLVALVLAGVALYTVATAYAGVEITWTLVAAAILVSMGLVAVAVVLKQRKDLKSGFPKDDERSRAIRMRAGYWAFYISLYFLFGMSVVLTLLEDHQIASLPAAEWGMIYVAVMGSIFLAVHTYLNRKGVPG